jgi:hypothetical protein
MVFSIIPLASPGSAARKWRLGLNSHFTQFTITITLLVNPILRGGPLLLLVAQNRKTKMIASKLVFHSIG